MDKKVFSKELRDLIKKHELTHTYDGRFTVTNLALPGQAISLDCIKEIVEIFPNLEHLDINTTEIGDDEIEELSKLEKLKWLDLSGNSNITDVGIKMLADSSIRKKLNWIDLTTCTIGDDCIDDLVKLENLTFLAVRSTKITVYQLSKLAGLKKLSKLYLVGSEAGNKLPKKLVDSANAQNIMNFILTKSNDSVPIGNYRLVLLGEPGSGKTALLSKLSGAISPESATLGVNIREVDKNVAGEEMKDVHLNVWDFGGQNNQLPIHELFLSETCIFTIVIEPRMNDCELAFKRWYHVIQKYWDFCHKNVLPLLIVFSKMDTLDGGIGHIIDSSFIDTLKVNIQNIIIDDTRLREGKEICPSDIPVKFINVSNKTPDGLDDLKKVIREILQNAKDIFHLTTSKEIVDFGQKLLDIKKDEFYVSREFALSLYRDGNYQPIPNPDQLENDFEDALCILDALGDIFYDEEADYIFIDPNKLSQIAYELICGNDMTGFLEKKELYDRIDENKFTEFFSKIYSMFMDSASRTLLTRTLLTFFEKRDLIVKKSDKTYFIPSRAKNIDPNTINQEIKTEKMLGCKHIVTTFDQEVYGLSLKLVSKLVKDYREKKAKNRKTYKEEIYKNGLILELPGEEVIVQIKESEKKLHFWISKGILERGFYDCIMSCLKENINPNFFKNYMVCPCCGRDMKLECENKYLISKLQAHWEADNNFFVQCVESDTLLSPSLILNGGIKLDYCPTNLERKRIESSVVYINMPYDRPGEEEKYNKLQESIKKVISDVNDILKKELNLTVDPYTCVLIKELITEDLSIDGEMDFWIRKSYIMLSILDEHRPNCYYELGKASILNKTRLTYINKELGDGPFDVNHTHHLDSYTNYDELCEMIKIKLIAIKKNEYKK